MRALHWRTLGIMSTVVISGCTTLKLPAAKPATDQKLSWAQRRANLTAINHWTIDGAFSLQTGNKLNIASYSWYQVKDNYSIQIHSSLNLFSLILKGGAGHVTLWESRQQPISASSPEALMQQRLAWHLPVTYLTYWVKGLPAPAPYAKQKLDAQQHLSQIQQQGWQVSFSHYTRVGQNDLPRMLQIVGHKLKIKIAIKHWSAF